MQRAPLLARVCCPCARAQPGRPAPWCLSGLVHAAGRGCSPSRGPRAPGQSTPPRAAPRCCCCLRRPPPHPRSGPAAQGSTHRSAAVCLIQHQQTSSLAAQRPHLDQDLHYLPGEVAAPMQRYRHTQRIHSAAVGATPCVPPTRDLLVSSAGTRKRLGKLYVSMWQTVKRLRLQACKESVSTHTAELMRACARCVG